MNKHFKKNNAMKNYLYLLLAFVMMAPVSLQSQNLLDPEVWKDYNPSAPEVGKLIEHREIPIDYTRGVANISIPLYEIESGGVKIPITLSYCNKGIRPSEQNFALGLGWKLTAEPMIAREINGHPDYAMTYVPYPLSYTQYKLHETYNGRWSGSDGSPDQYYYNLPGKSGSFMLLPKEVDKPLQAVTIPYEPVRIACDEKKNLIDITDIDGTRYYFGGKSAIGGSALLPDIWKGTKIVSPNRRDSVLFSYGLSFREEKPQLNDIFSIIYDSKLSTQELRISNYDNNYGIQLYDVIQNPNATPHMLQLMIRHMYGSPILGYTTSLNTYNKPYLTSIKYGHGEVALNYNNSTLSLIQIKDHSGISRRNIYLYQHTPYKDEQYVMLDSVVIKDGKGITLEAYKMDYYDPPRLYNREKCINFWGYYTGIGFGVYNKIPLLNDIPVKILGPYDNLFGKKEIKIPGRDMEYTANLAGMLKSIATNWGETTEFTYESDKYIKWNRDGSTTYMHNTGGSRIKEIRYTDPVLNETITKSIMYGDDGYGIVRRSITPDCYMHKQQIENVFEEHRGFNDMYTYTSNLSGDWTFSGSPVVYDKVTERTVATDVNGNEISNGKTVYYFNYPLDSLRRWSANDTVKWVAGTNIVFDPKDDWRYGQLIRKEIYKSSGSLISKNEYQYAQYGNPEISTVPCWKIYKDKIYQKEYTDPSGFEYGLRSNNYTPYSVWSYVIISGYMRLISEKEYQCSLIPLGNEVLLKTTTNSYNKKGFLTSVRTIYGDELSPETKLTTYVEDDTQADDPQHTIAREQLLKNGNIAAVMKQEIRVGKFKQINQDKYKLFANGLPLLNRRITKRDNNAAEERALIYEYDNYGNPLYTTKDGTNRMVYIWGYRGRYPVAIIQGVDFAQVTSALGSNAYFNQIADRHEPLDTDWERMEALRTLLPEAHVSLFCYDPFSGCILWESNPRGIKAYYDYDGKGRLIKTYYKEKDAQGIERERVLKTHEYQYRGF